MRKIDKIYTNCPFYDYRRIRAILKCNGNLIDSKRVFRLMKRMGLMAIFPKHNLLKANKEHKIFPYLLRERAINKVNEVCSTDISYIRMRWLSLPGQPLWIGTATMC